jgi:hypothetical protein
MPVTTMPDGFTARTLPQVLNRDEAALMASFTDLLAADIGVPFPQWARQCHQISLAPHRALRPWPGRAGRLRGRRLPALVDHPGR